MTIAICAIPIWWVRPLATDWTGSRMEPRMSPGRAAWWHSSPPSPDWAAPDGVTGVNGGVDLECVAQGAYSKNVGSRMYVLEGEECKQFKLLGKQLSCVVDASDLPCGTTGAVYFVEMPADGGMNKYGTGYCDAQCPRDVKWTKGGTNFPWTSSDKDPWDHWLRTSWSLIDCNPLQGRCD